MKNLSLNNKKVIQSQAGYSLVEVLVAITVLLIALVGPLTIAHTGLKRSNFAKEQTQAVFLAQEGIEAMVKLREDDALNASTYKNLNQVWSNYPAIASLCPRNGSNYCGVRIGENGNVAVASVYRCSGTNCAMRYTEGARVPYKQGLGSGVDSGYTRQLKVTVNNAYVHIISEVSWSPKPSDKVTLQTYIYNTYYEP